MQIAGITFFHASCLVILKIMLEQYTLKPLLYVLHSKPRGYTIISNTILCHIAKEIILEKYNNERIYSF